ncbi:hypothetical protein ACF0H5_007851 [Mactra antiquata]
MSRYPHEKMGPDMVKAICGYSPDYIAVENIPCKSINLVDVWEEAGQTLAQKEFREIRKAQRSDPLVECWRKAVIDKTLPAQTEGRKHLCMRKQFNNLVIKRGILYRQVHRENEQVIQLVVPSTYWKEVLTGLHDDIGHPGIERTTRLVRDRFYWPGMASDIEKHVRSCHRCLRRKDKSGQRAPLVNISSAYPLDLVCMDYLTLEPSRGIGNILVITDHFTKFAVAIPTKNQTAKTTADALLNHFFHVYGIPSRLHSDQGANFESQVIQELCMLMGVQKSRTTPYHPQGNAGPERFNRSLLEMLGTLENWQKSDWRKYIGSLVYAYNCIPHDSTGVSPYQLMFGRRPKLPIDSVFEQALVDEEPVSVSEYIRDLGKRMKELREVVTVQTKKAQRRQKTQYDKKAKPFDFSVGDLVLVRRTSFEGKHKIADRYEEEVYTIIEQPKPDIPVFRVRCGDRERTLHRNLLFLLDSVNVVEDEVMEDEVSSTKTDGIDMDASRDRCDVTGNDDTDSESLDESLGFEDCIGDAQFSESDQAADVLGSSDTTRNDLDVMDVVVETDDDDDDREDSIATDGDRSDDEVDHVSDSDLDESEDEAAGDIESVDAESHDVDSTDIEILEDEEIESSSLAGDDVDQDDVVDTWNDDERNVDDGIIPADDANNHADDDHGTVDEDSGTIEESETEDLESEANGADDDAVVEGNVDIDDVGGADVDDEVDREVTDNAEDDGVANVTGNVDDIAVEYEGATAETLDTEVDEGHKSPPVPQPRRSARERRVPQRYSDYIMHQMVVPPDRDFADMRANSVASAGIDLKISALFTLMGSGVLDSVEPDIAKGIVACILKM